MFQKLYSWALAVIGSILTTVGAITYTIILVREYFLSYSLFNVVFSGIVFLIPLLFCGFAAITGILLLKGKKIAFNFNRVFNIACIALGGIGTLSAIISSSSAIMDASQGYGITYLSQTLTTQTIIGVISVAILLVSVRSLKTFKTEKRMQQIAKEMPEIINNENCTKNTTEITKQTDENQLTTFHHIYSYGLIFVGAVATLISTIIALTSIGADGMNGMISLAALAYCGTVCWTGIELRKQKRTAITLNNMVCVMNNVPSFILCRLGIGCLTSELWMFIGLILLAIGCAIIAFNAWTYRYYKNIREEFR